MRKLPQYRKSGFTLIELLVTAAIFAAVAVIATSAFANSLQLQYNHKENQESAAQMRQITNQLSQAIQESLTHSATGGSQSTTGLLIVPLQAVAVADQSTNGYEPDTMLIVVVPVRDSFGQPPSQINDQNYEKDVYCAQPVSDASGTIIGKQLVRFQVTPTSVSTIDNLYGSTYQCTQSSIQSMFQTPNTVSQPTVLTDPFLEISSLRFSAVWMTSALGLPNLDPDGVRIELAARYNPNNSSGGQLESRASGLASVSQLPALFSRTVVDRKSYMFNP
ncbi:prepilin-type N-terminal cleavage/methylation domain-containing protein [Patescibacteria group bacterium]|nr:prepilin-type N-terminal cleavage/methylation domain-containing protein [Patescibacteria group bacterium]